MATKPWAIGERSEEAERGRQRTSEIIDSQKEETGQAGAGRNTVADQIRLQRQERIVTLIIEGLGEREPELLNMLSEGDWDEAELFRNLMERLKERHGRTRKPGR